MDFTQITFTLLEPEFVQYSYNLTIFYNLIISYNSLKSVLDLKELYLSSRTSLGSENMT